VKKVHNPSMAIENNSLASEAAAATSEASSGGGGAEETAAAAVTTSSTKTPAGVATLGKQIEEMRNKSLAKGDTWYLLDAKWHEHLKKFFERGKVLSGGSSVSDHQVVPSTNSPNETESMKELSALNPGRIDNSALFKPSNNTQDVDMNDASLNMTSSLSLSGTAAAAAPEAPDIREQMIDDIDYVLMPEEAWKILVREFGLTHGQAPIARKVVEHGMFVKHCKVEVYKNDFLLAENSNLGKTYKKKFSKADTLDNVAAVMRKQFGYDANAPVRLWVKFTSNTFDQLAQMEQTVQDAGLFTGQLIVVEKQNEDGSWPRDENKGSVRNSASGATSTPSSTVDNLNNNNNNLKNNTKAATNTPSSTSWTIDANNHENSNSTINSNQEMRQPSSTVGSTSGNSWSGGGATASTSSGTQGVGADKTQPGLCGLSNLGNTCFMNSIIQGLSNTPPIMEYFACDNYQDDINEDNPLGMKGEIARTFGEVIKSMWSGKYSYVMPRNFKGAVGRFAPQFSGYQQQDSQELLTFLLDGLHEDLNRVRKKPYTEIKDSGGRPDEEVAEEAWKVYKMRNDSVILDLFHGLQKSTVVCPECPKISVVFDPLCYLSLPLPVRKERVIEVFMVFMDQSRPPTQYKVTCPKNGCMRDMCEALSKLVSSSTSATSSQIPPDRMVVTDVYNHRFHKVYGPDEALSSILERDDIFVYEVPTTNREDPGVAVTPIYLREKKSSQSYSPSNLFGQPLLLGIPRNLDYESLYNHIVTTLTRFVSAPPEDSCTGDNPWWKKPKVAKVNGTAAADASMEEKSQENGNGDARVNGEVNGEEEEEEEEGEEDDDGKGPPKMFVMNLVNSYGNAQMEELKNDGRPINMGKNYLSLDWHPRAKELFYNEKAAEEVCQDESFLQKNSTPANKQQSVSLNECLELYTTTEKLKEDNAWRCPDCKKEQQATKKFDLWSLPAVLVISLKRFSFNRYWRDKLDTQVDFPVHGLDLSPYIINKNHGPALYDLIAVSNHFGGMGGGHYTAYAKNKDDSKWYYFDDSAVTLSSESEVVTKAAYVLFYLRRDLSASTFTNTQNTDGACGASNCNGQADASSVEDMDIN